MRWPETEVGSIWYHLAQVLKMQVYVCVLCGSMASLTRLNDGVALLAASWSDMSAAEEPDDLDAQIQALCFKSSARVHMLTSCVEH